MLQRYAGALIAMAAAILATSHSSLAADLPVAPPPVKAPAMVPPVLVPNWSGFYVNGGFGYGLWTATSSTSAQLPEPVTPFEEFRGGRGWLARVGGGYDHQFGSIVAGVFADFDYSSLKGTIRDDFGGQSADIKQTSSWAAGARIGLLATPEILSYVNAGYTSARFSSGTMVAYYDCGTVCAPNQPHGGMQTGFVSPAFTATGWFLGGGVEAALGSGWFWRNEYRYAYYGNEAVQDLNISAPGVTSPRYNDINFKPTVQTFTTQIAYKFNSGPIPERAPRGRGTGSWTGIHLDGGIGYGQWVADLTSTQIPASNGEGAIMVAQHEGGKGWLGRVGGGYDFQFNRFVAGAFADFDFSSLKGTLSDSVAIMSGDIKQQWSWAAGARAGVLLTPDLLGYLNGGYTSAHFSPVTLTDASAHVAWAPGSQAQTAGFTRSGWFAGVGTEYSLTSILGYELPIRGLFWRNEYRFASYGTQVLSVPVNGIAAGVCTCTQLNDINFKPTVQTITTQLVYRFGG